MSGKVIPIETEEERDQAWELSLDIENAGDHVPGWMYDESKAEEVVNRLRRAVNAYDRKHPEAD